MLLNKKFLKILGPLFILMLVFSFFSQAYATSWIILQPEEVEKRAQIVVSGKYDTDKQYKSIDMWAPFDFKVDAYYKGSGPEVILASIENFDVGWSVEHQDKGDSFLLFLEKHPTREGLWVPVAGPNGMVLLKDGKVQALDSAKNSFYEKYLAERQGSQPEAASVSRVSFYVYGGLFLVLLAAVGVLVWKRRRRA